MINCYAYFQCFEIQLIQKLLNVDGRQVDDLLNGLGIRRKNGRLREDQRNSTITII